MATTRIYLKPAGAMWFDLNTGDMPLPAQLSMWQSQHGWIVSDPVLIPLDAIWCVLQVSPPVIDGGTKQPAPQPTTSGGVVTGLFGASNG